MLSGNNSSSVGPSSVAAADADLHGRIQVALTDVNEGSTPLYGGTHVSPCLGRDMQILLRLQRRIHLDR